MSRPSRSRVRAAASLAAVLGLALAGTLVATATAPAQSAAPAGDCATPFPVASLAAGDAVTGLTVTHGTTPDGFTGQVLGVLDDGIGPGLDMVMVRLSSPEIDKIGIWQGMSGSPVYAADGRLIGAVAYGLAMGTSTVAGVTPFEAMDDYLAAPATVHVDHAAARQIARRTDVSAARASQGFDQLPMPLGVAGVGASRLAAADRLASGHSWLPRSTYAVGRAGAADATATDLVAGGNLAASMSYGDVTMAGIGTVTSVCGDRVVGFGHPMNWAGRTTLGLHPADAIYIQDDLVSGFKVANLGAPVGTITDDRQTGITGTIGALPDTTQVTSTATYGDRSRTGVSHVVLDTPDSLASTTFYGIIANHQAVVDGPVRGTEDLAWTITGTGPGGQPFSLHSSDLYSGKDLTYDLGFAVGDLVFRIAKIPGVTIDSVTTDGTLRDDIAKSKVTGVEVREHGTWVKAGVRSPVLAQAGKTLHARVTLTGGGVTSVVPAALAVPQRFAGRQAILQVVGGANAAGRPPKDLAKLQAWIDGRVRTDEVVVALSDLGRVSVGGSGSSSSSGVVPRARVERKAGGPRTVQTVIGPFGSVVKGHALGLVVVE